MPRRIAILAGAGVLLAAAVVLAAVWRRTAPPDSPWDHLPPRLAHVDHKALVRGPFQTGRP